MSKHLIDFIGISKSYDSIFCVGCIYLYPETYLQIQKENQEAISLDGIEALKGILG